MIAQKICAQIKLGNTGLFPILSRVISQLRQETINYHREYRESQHSYHSSLKNTRQRAIILLLKSSHKIHWSSQFILVLFRVFFTVIKTLRLCCHCYSHNTHLFWNHLSAPQLHSVTVPSLSIILEYSHCHLLQS